MKKTVIIFTAGLFLFSVACQRQEPYVSLSMFHWDFEIDEQSSVYKGLQEKLNVNIVAVSAPWSEWANKLNIMVASGEIPDIFVTYGPGDPDSFERLVREGLLLPLSSHLDDFPNIKEKLVGRENQRLDGEYYAIPVALPKSDHVGMIRGDWLDQLGLKVPANIEELYQVTLAFKQAFGIYPISSSPPHTAGFFWLNPIFYAFGGGWDTWLKDGQGNYVMCWVSEGNRLGLKFVNRLYRAGLLDPEFFANTDAQKMDRFLSSKAGIVFHNNISLFTDQFRSIDPIARIFIFDPVQGPEGNQGQWAMDGFFTAVSIHANISTEKREKALELMDFLCSPEGLTLMRYGVEGVHYEEKDGDKAPLLPQENGVYKRLREVDKTASLRDFVELGDIWTPVWDQNHDLIRRAVCNGEKYGHVPLFLYDRTEAEREHKKQLTDMVFQEYVSLVQSDNFDADWDIFVNKWYEYGGREMTDQRNR